MERSKMTLSQAIRFSLAGLATGSMACSIAIGLLLLLVGPTLTMIFRGGLFVGYSFVVAFVLGLLPLLAIGAPSYLLLARSQRARYTTALLIGLIPAAMVAVVELGLFAALVAIYGGTSGLLTHYFAERSRRKSLHANNSSKPTPLRGAA
jgi:hypothetical protein